MALAYEHHGESAVNDFTDGKVRWHAVLHSFLDRLQYKNSSSKKKKKKKKKKGGDKPENPQN